MTKTSKTIVDPKMMTFKIEGRLYDIMDDLVYRTHTSSKVEVLRKAITLTDAVATAAEKGETLILRDKGTGKEREIIILW